MFSMTKMVTPHNPQLPQWWPPDGQTRRLFLAAHVSSGFSAVSRAASRRDEWCLCQTEGSASTVLTSFSRALAFSSGSIRRPAVAFRTTGVRLHASLGMAFLAIFRSWRMVLPPCNGGNVSSSYLSLISDRHVSQATPTAAGISVIAPCLNHLNPTHRKSRWIWWSRGSQLTPNISEGVSRYTYLLRIVLITRQSRLHCMVNFIVQNWKLNCTKEATGQVIKGSIM